MIDCSSSGAPGEIRSPVLRQLPDFPNTRKLYVPQVCREFGHGTKTAIRTKSGVIPNSDPSETFTLRLRGRIWWANARSADGQRLRFSTGETDRLQARKAASIKLAEHRTEQALTLGDLLVHLWETRWATSRAAIQLRYSVPLCKSEVGHWPADGVTYPLLDGYAKELQASGLAPATINRRLSLISVALREGNRLGWCPAPPLFPHMREPPGRDRYLTHEEERAILAECEALGVDAGATKRAEWDYMADLVVTLLDTGMRLSEALTTRPDHINGDMLHIGDHRTKSQRGRIIPLTPRALAAVTRLVHHPWHYEGASVDSCGHRFMVIRRRLRMVEGVCLHVLRHTCAARLLAAGVDIYTVSKWLGHSSVKVTERYAKLQVGMLTVAREALSRHQLSRRRMAAA